MISRRNIRIKVMQNLYALKALSVSEGDEVQKNVKIAQQQILKNMEESNRIFIHLLYVMMEVAKYTEKDARKRAARKRPSQDDLHVSTKLAHSYFVEELKNNESFEKKIREYLIDKRVDSEFIRGLYLRLTKKEEYKKYVQEEDSKTNDQELLKEFFATLLFDDEEFNQVMDDHYIQWQDDLSVMEILISNFLKKPSSFHFNHLLSGEKKEYATELIRTVMEKQVYCREWIKPRLKNWDPDRVAIIDMLLLHMGVCEFLYFPTIPPRVTINEYIDLAKDYSTNQSGQFINGVLDNILKTLKKEGKLNKVERKH